MLASDLVVVVVDLSLLTLASETTLSVWRHWVGLHGLCLVVSGKNAGPGWFTDRHAHSDNLQNSGHFKAIHACTVECAHHL